jgi:hypothetical protein
MNRKILIASLFATLMLLVPTTSIVGVSDDEDDCNCKPISNLHHVTLERLSNKLDRSLNRLEVYTGILSILYKHNPKVTKEFKELSNEITTLQESNNNLKPVFKFGLYDRICDAIASIIFPLLELYEYLLDIIKVNPALIPVLMPIFLALLSVLVPLGNLYYYILFCGYPE